MSAVIEQPLDFGTLSPDIIETSTGRKIRQASAVRWVWQPFRDIKLFDNLTPAVLNSLTLREIIRDGERVSDPIQTLRRCQPYPLTNCEYEVARHEAKRYGNFGEEIPENDLPNDYAGPTPSNPKTSHVVESKFAYSSARELSEMYAKEFGLVVLEPLTGVEDSNVVRQMFELVQPATFKLHTLAQELTSRAPERIRQSKASPDVKAKAEGCRVLMLRGLRAATKFAGEHMADFSRQVQLASTGKKGQRAFPVEFDEFVADHLGVEVPRVVQTEKKSDKSEELLERLAERELAKGGENAALDRALQMLEEEREERRKLEERVNQLAAAAAQTNGKAPKGSQT